MAKVIIRCVGYPDGSPCPSEGMWVLSCDHEAHDGIGEVVFTESPERALSFPDITAALEFYRRSPDCKPLRADGEPNRPLTAMNALFEQIEERLH